MTPNDKLRDPAMKTPDCNRDAGAGFAEARGSALRSNLRKTL